MTGGGIGYRLNDTELKAAFKQAAAAGADTLLHVSHVDLDMSTSLMCLMDSYARFEQTLVVREQDPATAEAAARFFRGDAPFIKGVYDLKKPFAEAKITTQTLPAALQYAIRENMFEQQLKHTPWYGKLGLLTEGRRDAAKARIEIPSQP